METDHGMLLCIQLVGGEEGQAARALSSIYTGIHTAAARTWNSAAKDSHGQQYAIPANEQWLNWALAVGSFDPVSSCELSTTPAFLLSWPQWLADP